MVKFWVYCSFVGVFCAAKLAMPNNDSKCNAEISRDRGISIIQMWRSTYRLTVTSKKVQQEHEIVNQSPCKRVLQCIRTRQQTGMLLSR